MFLDLLSSIPLLSALPHNSLIFHVWLTLKKIIKSRCFFQTLKLAVLAETLLFSNFQIAHHSDRKMENNIVSAMME